MNETMAVPAELLDRLRDVEHRILELAHRLDPLVDIRGAVADPAPTVESLLGRLQSLTTWMRQREHLAEWDAVDQLTARLMLHTLADLAVELRRALNQGAAMLESARADAQSARRALESLERELTPTDNPE